MEEKLEFNESLNPVNYQTAIAKKHYDQFKELTRGKLFIEKMEVVERLKLKTDDVVRLNQEHGASDPYANQSVRYDLINHLSELVIDVALLCELYAISLGSVMEQGLSNLDSKDPSDPSDNLNT